MSEHNTPHIEDTAPVKDAGGTQSSGIEEDIRKSSLIGVAMVGALTLSLLLVQFGLGRQIDALEAEAVAPEAAIVSLEKAVSALHARQTRVLTSHTREELSAFDDRSALESRLTTAVKTMGEVKPAHAEALEAQTQAFLQVDDFLYANVQAHHTVAEAFDTQRAAVEVKLRALIESATGIAGVSRLDTVLLLRRLKAQPGNAALAREVVFGNGRVQQEAVAEVVKGVLHLGALSGKIGLAPNQDALNGLIANEIPQAVATTQAAFLAWRRATTDAGLLKRVDGLETAWASILPLVTDVNNDTSLVSMRRQALAQREAAVKVSEAEAKTAAELDRLLGVVEAEVNASVRDIAGQTGIVVWSSRIVTALLLALGAVAMLTGRKRINASVSALRKQNKELADLRDSLRDINANLEAQVESRTAALAAREASMRLILDSTGDGLAHVTLGGDIVGELSKSMHTWFGEPVDGVNIGQYLFPEHTDRAFEIRLGLEQFADGFLPFELLASQMIRRIERDGRILGLDWLPIGDEDELTGVLLIVTDDTAKVEGERAERRAREMQISVRHILRDEPGFVTFLRDNEALLDEIHPETPRAAALRALHTLKGNCGVMGFGDVARTAHNIEDALAECEREVVAPGHVTQLRTAWAESRAQVADYLSEGGALDVSTGDVERLLTAIEGQTPHDELAGMVSQWWYTPVSAYLERLAEQSESVARRLGRPIQVSIDADGYRAPDAFSPFFSSLIHVVRNAVDHGIESEDKRVENGKPREGQIVFASTRDSTGNLWVELRDDGAGVDWQKLRARAEAKGLKGLTTTELLFSDGLSTRDQVTELSGRGVGLAAVQHAVHDLGGTVDVESNRGHGTAFRFSFPADAVAAAEAAHARAAA